MSYATADEVEQHLSSNGQTISEVHRLKVEQKLAAAEAAVNSFCGRSFDAAATATDQYLWPRWIRREGIYVVPFDQDMYDVDAVTSDDSDTGTYGTSWTLNTDYILEPRNGVRDGVSGWPYDGLRVRSTRTVRLSGEFEQIKVNGKVGWAAVPAQVKAATLVLASQLMAQTQTPTGVLGFSEFGLRLPNNLYQQISGLLMPFCRVGGTGLGGIA